MSDILLGNRAVLVAANHAIQAAERVEELRRELAQAESFLVARRCEVVDELDALRACDPDAWPTPGLTSLQMGEWRVDIQPRYYDCTQRFGGVVVSKIVPEQLTNIGEAIAQIDRQVAQEPATDVPAEVSYEEQPKFVCGCNPKQKEACARARHARPRDPIVNGCRNA